ncbi:hypothetical protein C8R43DRAFT_1148005 [Mycena crocata]|nr:hypothetical protein C8R43DRAFT_1148005 [Mycena crocata]
MCLNTRRFKSDPKVPTAYFHSKLLSLRRVLQAIQDIQHTLSCKTEFRLAAYHSSHARSNYAGDPSLDSAWTWLVLSISAGNRTRSPNFVAKRHRWDRGAHGGDQFPRTAADSMLARIRCSGREAHAQPCFRVIRDMSDTAATRPNSRRRQESNPNCNLLQLTSAARGATCPSSILSPSRSDHERLTICVWASNGSWSMYLAGSRTALGLPGTWSILLYIPRFKMVALSAQRLAPIETLWVVGFITRASNSESRTDREVFLRCVAVALLCCRGPGMGILSERPPPERIGACAESESESRKENVQGHGVHGGGRIDSFVLSQVLCWVARSEPG